MASFRHEDSIDSTGSVTSLPGSTNYLATDTNAFPQVAQTTGQLGNRPSDRDQILNSIGSSSSIDGEARLMNQEGVFQLTKDLRRFSEALTALKTVFIEERGKSVRILAHERLGELLTVLKQVVDKYAELNSAEILGAAGTLIKHVKEFNYEDDLVDISPDIFRAINNLAMAFCTSVSECLMGDIQFSPPLAMSTSQSFDNLEQSTSQFRNSVDVVADVTEAQGLKNDGTTSPMLENVDDLLQRIDGGIEMSFDRAKLLSKYLNELITYVKKKAALEIDHAKSILKLSQTTKTNLSEQSFLPFQSLYCTALDHDKEYASNCQTMYQSSLLQQKFIDPLQAKKNEHDKRRKSIRDMWQKDKRRSEDAINNMKKAKQAYQAKIHEYQKAKEAAIRAEGEQSQQMLPHRHGSSVGSGTLSSVLHSAAASGKMEKKKKLEEDTNIKATQAERNYKSYVNEANKRLRELEENKIVYLQQLRDLIGQCDQTAKTVTVAYFQHHYNLFSPLPVQFQAMYEDARRYEPGFQYSDYIRNLPAQPTHQRAEFVFEPCTVEGAPYLIQAVKNDTDESPGQTASRKTRRSKVNSDTESSSSRSVEDFSPSTSPGDLSRARTGRRPSTEGSLSSEDVLDEPVKETNTNSLALPVDRDLGQTPNSSPVAKRSQMTKQAAKMVSNVREAFKLPKKPPKATVFGVDFSIAAQDALDGIPYVVKRCVAEIDNRALTTKGIYRINGVKNRVEKICAQFELSPNSLDLSVHSPHDVSSVLKCFLRQLPEPLLRFELYTPFLQIAKDYQTVITETNQAVNLAREEGRPAPPPPSREILDTLVGRIRDTVNRLPMPNHNTLQYIVSHLTRIASHSRDNKMTASNLAIVFGPTLMRQVLGDGNESLIMLIDMPFQSRIVEMLIEHKDFIFNTHSHQAGNIFPFPGFQNTPSSYAPENVDDNALTPDSAISEPDDLAASVSDLSFVPSGGGNASAAGVISHEQDILLDFGDSPAFPQSEDSSNKQSSSENYSTSTSGDLLPSIPPRNELGTLLPDSVSMNSINGVQDLQLSATNPFRRDIDGVPSRRQPSIPDFMQQQNVQQSKTNVRPNNLEFYQRSNSSSPRRNNSNLLLDISPADSPTREPPVNDDVWAAPLAEAPKGSAPVAPKRSSKFRKQRKSTDDSESGRSRSDTLHNIGRRFSQITFGGKRPSLSKTTSSDDLESRMPQNLPPTPTEGHGRSLPSLPNHVAQHPSTAGRTPPQLPMGQYPLRKSNTLPLSVRPEEQHSAKPTAKREILLSDSSDDKPIKLC